MKFLVTTLQTKLAYCLFVCLCMMTIVNKSTKEGGEEVC